MKNLFFIIIFGFLLQGSNEINNLRIFELPTYKEALSYKSKNTFDYEVYKENGKSYYRNFDYRKVKGPKIELKIKYDSINYRDFGGRQQNVKLDNGYLIGHDRGEFGGSLYWFGDNGIDNYKICNGNIKDIIIFKDKILVTEGLAHLGGNKGQILELKNKNGKWVSENYLNLKSVPYASELNSKNELIILTYKELIKISSDKKITELISDGFWSNLYPNSSIIENDIVYFGMRKGIIKMDLKTKKTEWLAE